MDFSNSVERISLLYVDLVVGKFHTALKTLLKNHLSRDTDLKNLAGRATLAFN